MNLQRLLQFLIPNPDDCRAAAAELREAHPNLSSEELAQRAVASAKKLAAGTGAALGLLGSPLTWLPTAAADATAVLKIEGTMAGTVAALLDAEVLDDDDQFRTDILAIVFPGLASQALRVAGVRSGMAVTRRLIRSIGARRMLEQVGKIAGRRLGMRFVERALITKAVPIVGAGIGGGWNWLEVHAVGQRAISYYLHRPILPAGRTVVRRSPWSRLRKALGRNDTDAASAEETKASSRGRLIEGPTDQS